MILFSDFDHTFYIDNDIQATHRNILALRDWKKAGHQFAFATGRNYTSLKNIVGPAFMPACDFLILDGGSIVVTRENKLLRVFSFSPEVVQQIEQAVATMNPAPVIVYHNPSSVVFVSTTQVTKIHLWFKDASELEQATKDLAGIPLFIFRSVNPKPSSRPELEGRHAFLELIPENSGKNKGIEALASMYNIPPENIVTIGDGENDRAMIENYNGYMISNSKLAATGADFKKVDSFADLISSLLNRN